MPKNKSRIPEAFCKVGYAAFLHTETAVKKEERTMKEISIQELEGLSIGQAENKAAATGCTVLLLGKKGACVGQDVHSATAAPASVRCIRHWRRSPLQHKVLSALFA